MIRGALPFAAALGVPTILFAVIYLVQGENPAYGLVAGGIGLLGSLSAGLVRAIRDRRDAIADLERYRANPIATIARWKHEDEHGA